MLFEDIQKANIDALKAHDKVARAILSVLFGKFKNESIEKGLGAKELPDSDCVRIIQKTIKELEDEILGYKKAGREDTVAELETQKDVISKYLPKMMSEDEIRSEIEKLDDKSIPSIMKHFKTQFLGKCDMGVVNKIAKEFN